MPAVKEGSSRRLPVRPEPCFGAHLSIAGGMHHSIESALRLGFDTVQVFIKNQRQWRASPLRTDDLKEWFRLRETPGFGPPIAHATYLINLAAPDERMYAQSTAAFREELRRCDTLEIPYLVVHPGAAGTNPLDVAIARVAAALDVIFDADPGIRTMVLLEATAGQGTCLGCRLEDLGSIIDRVQEPARIGVCIDTCHVFAAGYDIRDPRQFSDMLAAADRSFGLEKVRCWHLNDSKRELGSRVDRHEHIGRGQIGAAGFRNVLSDRRLAGVPMILETPKGQTAAGRDWDAVNLSRLRRLAGFAGRAARPGSGRRSMRCA